MLRDSKLEIKHGDSSVNLKFFCHSPLLLKFRLWWNICRNYSEMEKYTLQDDDCKGQNMKASLLLSLEIFPLGLEGY